MTHQRALESLRRQYFWLDSHFDDLHSHCTSSAERSRLRAAYVGSRDNLRDARLRIFIDQDPTAGLLLAELQSAMDRIEEVVGLGFFDGALQLVTLAVSTASRLVGCGSIAA